MSAINPLDMQSEDLQNLEALFSSHPRKRVFKKRVPYASGASEVILTHTLVRYPRKNNAAEIRTLVVNDADRQCLGAGNTSTVFTSNHTLKNGLTVQKSVEKERIIKFQRTKTLREDAVLQQLTVAGCAIAQSLERLHHKPGFFAEDVRVEIERRLPGIELDTWLCSPAVDNLSIEQRFTLSQNLLEALHSQVTVHGLLHRDISSNNILINPETLSVNIIDFGFACRAPSTDNVYPDHTVFGAPESHFSAEIQSCSAKSDLYSLALILCMVWEYQPAKRAIFDIPQFVQPAESLNFNVRRDLFKLLDDLTEDDPDKRPDVIYAIIRMGELGYQASQNSATFNPPKHSGRERQQNESVSKNTLASQAAILEECILSLEDNKDDNKLRNMLWELQEQLRAAELIGLNPKAARAISKTINRIKYNSTIAENRGHEMLLAVITNIGILIAGLGVFGLIGLAATAGQRGSFFWRPKAKMLEVVEGVEHSLRPTGER